MSDDRYFWGSDASVTIDEFLTKNRPSVITDDMTPWIWVQGASGKKEDPELGGDQSGALSQAADILSGLEKRLAEIESDDSIPTRAKKGVKSKKAVRDEAHETAAKELKDLSIKSKWITGKWLFFPRNPEIDGIWSTLAKSVVEGPLKEAGVQLAKVAPSPQTTSGEESPTHVVCLYVQNVYDKEAVRTVDFALHACVYTCTDTACKSDLYTLAGIDSKHPTKLRSSIWRTHELIEGGGDAIKEMKAQYRASRTANSTGSPKKSAARTDGIIDSDSEDDRVVQAGKRKSVSTASPKKAAQAVPEKKVKSLAPRKPKPKSAAQKFQENDIFGGGDIDSD